MRDQDRPDLHEGEGAEGGEAEDALEAVVEKVSAEHGFDVRGYKRSTLYRRISKRMSDSQCETVEDYLVRLETDPHEYAQLVNTILINVTEFFRDPAAWQDLETACLAPLVREAVEAKSCLRVWSVGCSTGEEAYSLSIALREQFGTSGLSCKLYATDVDEGALAVARAGVYGPDKLRHMDPDRLSRCFDELPGGRYRVRREIRAPVIFGHHNVIDHPPISRLDLLVCRNLLIYYDTETQQHLLRRFHYALRERAFLFLGKAETLMSRSTLFRPVEPRHRIFQKVYVPGAGERLARILPPVAAEAPPRAAAAEAGHLVGVDALRGPVLLLDGDGLLLAASPAARETFGISDRHLGASLASLSDQSRPALLRVAVEDARATGKETRLDELRMNRPDGRPVVLSVDIAWTGDGPGGRGGRLLVWCNDDTRRSEVVEELHQLRQELETTSEELQTTNEELETTNEELQSTNEELETTNEELQSTNEELETTVEELQSSNEELETANDELRARQDELNARERLQNSVLGSLQMGVVVVRSNLDILSWNRICEQIWGAREEELLGQNLLTLDTGMPFSSLRELLFAAMEDAEPPSPVEVDAVNRRGKAIRCRVRALPLTVPEEGVAGALILLEPLSGSGG